MFHVKRRWVHPRSGGYHKATMEEKLTIHPEAYPPLPSSV